MTTTQKLKPLFKHLHLYFPFRLIPVQVSEILILGTSIMSPTHSSRPNPPLRQRLRCTGPRVILLSTVRLDTCATLLVCSQLSHIAPGTPPPKGAMRFGRAIHGIVGLITLTLCTCPPKRVFSMWRLGLTPSGLTAEYLILITNRERFGGISTNDVFNANEFEIMPLNPDVSVQNPSHPVEAYLLALVKSHLNGGSFFFSYTWDLTRRLQVQWLAEKTDADKALWEVVGVTGNCACSIYRINPFLGRRPILLE